jgi:hypothetical protein
VKVAKYAGWWLLLLVLAQGVRAQVQIGDDLRMNLNGMLTGGYTDNYGDQIQSSHSLTAGGNANLFGSYFDPNFLNFDVVPYYNQSRANSTMQSLTDASGVNGNANFFTGSRFPGNFSYEYAHNNTGTYGLIGAANFTTIGTTNSFGIGWSALLPNWPTFSVSYSQGRGAGNVFGTSEETHSSSKLLSVRSDYDLHGWRLNARYQHSSIDTSIPIFLGGEPGKSDSDFTDNSVAVGATHSLPWNGSMTTTFSHTTYAGDFGSSFQDSTGNTNYTTNIENANFNFHPTLKWGLYVSQTYTNNLSGYLYQTANSGNGVPLTGLNSGSNSTTLTSGTSYAITKNLYGQASITYYDQNYLGKSYQGSYLTGTVGYGRRILDTFTVSASVIESSNKFANNSLGFIGNLNAFHRLGRWEFSGGASYAQNVQTLLVTYTNSYYQYNANVHRALGRGMQWTGAFNGTHSGYSQYQGTVNQSEGFTTSLSWRRINLNGNYSKSRGQALLTSTGIQPITQPGLFPEDLIVYDGESYGGGLSITPIPRLYISGSYSRAFSDTLSNAINSRNSTNIFYGQVQYRLRQISLLGGYTKFGQSISAGGATPGNQYSFFIGVTRSFNFF